MSFLIPYSPPPPPSPKTHFPLPPFKTSITSIGVFGSLLNQYIYISIIKLITYLITILIKSYYIIIKFYFSQIQIKLSPRLVSSPRGYTVMSDTGCTLVAAGVVIAAPWGEHPTTPPTTTTYTYSTYPLFTHTTLYLIPISLPIIHLSPLHYSNNNNTKIYQSQPPTHPSSYHILFIVFSII